VIGAWCLKLQPIIDGFELLTALLRAAHYRERKGAYAADTSSKTESITSKKIPRVIVVTKSEKKSNGNVGITAAPHTPDHDSHLLPSPDRTSSASSSPVNLTVATPNPVSQSPLAMSPSATPSNRAQEGDILMVSRQAPTTRETGQTTEPSLSRQPSQTREVSLVSKQSLSKKRVSGTAVNANLTVINNQMRRSFSQTSPKGAPTVASLLLDQAKPANVSRAASLSISRKSSNEAASRPRTQEQQPGDRSATSNTLQQQADQVHLQQLYSQPSQTIPEH